MSDIVLSIWRGPISRPDPIRLAIEGAAGEEARRHGVSLGEVLGASKRRPVMAARRAALARVLEETGCSLRALARIWGRDRSNLQRLLRTTVVAAE